jgi:hypothetical protein
MSKRVLILLAVGVLAIVAGILLLKYELTRQDPDPEPEPEPEPEETEIIEPEPEEPKYPLRPKEKFTGFKKGFTWDKLSKCYIPNESEPELKATPAQYLTPEEIPQVTPTT